MWFWFREFPFFTTKSMPKGLLFLPLCFWVVAVRAMPAAALTTVSPFKEIGGRKHPIPFRCPVIVSIFEGDSLFHLPALSFAILTLQKYASGAKI